MRVCSSLAELAVIEHPLVFGSGVFDGVHLGHQAVLARTRELATNCRALPAALSFHPHPATVLRPDACPKWLTTRQQKHRLLAEQGLAWLIELPFTPEFAQLSGEDFVRQLLRALPNKLRGWCAGENWSFGHRRSGHLDLLRDLGAEAGFQVEAIPPVFQGEEIVSSTRIRQAVAAGDLDQARECLSRPFAIAGLVQRGAQMGRRLGFPTANLGVKECQQFPPAGVYAGLVTTREGVRTAAINFGRRPTVDPDRLDPILEAHLLDWNGDLYDQEIEVAFDQRIRGEQKFHSIEELRAQIGRDIRKIREIREEMPRRAGTS